MDLPRRLALDSLYNIMYKHKFCEDEATKTLKGFNFSLEERDLFLDLLTGSLDNINNIFFYLEPFCDKRTKKWIKVFGLVILYETVILKKDLDKTFDTYKPLFLVNGRLLFEKLKRIVTKAYEKSHTDITESDTISYLSKKYSYPSWFVAYLLKDFKKSEVEELINKKRSHDVYLNSGNLDNEDIVDYIYRGEEVVLYNGCLPGERLKLISAKAHQVFATDIDRYKINGLVKRFKNNNIDNVSFQIVKPQEVAIYAKNESFDLVVLDLPSTGTGFLNRTFEWKYRLSPEGILDVVMIMKEILYSNCLLTKVGGNIALIISSFLKEETKDLIDAFLKEHDNFELVDTKVIKKDNYFYLARLKRNR